MRTTDPDYVHSGMVYDDAEKLYAEVRKDGDAILEEAFNVIFPKSLPLIGTKSLPYARNADIVAYNTTFFSRQDVVEVPLGLFYLRSELAQTSRDGKTGYALMQCMGGASCGALTPGLDASCTPVSGQSSVSLYSSIITDVAFFFSLCSVHQWL